MEMDSDFLKNPMKNLCFSDSRQPRRDFKMKAYVDLSISFEYWPS